MTGFGRTPVHQAVNRLAADTLIVIRPRHGLQIAPIDLARERVLLHLRRDIERFVIRLAAERAGPSHRNQMLHLERLLRERRDTMTIGEFNMLDRRIDKLILAAAGEPFLEHTLRPLHTIFRRIGWIHHNHMRGRGQPPQDDRLPSRGAQRDRQPARRPGRRGLRRADRLRRRHVRRMEREIDPSLLDCSLEPLIAPGTLGTADMRIVFHGENAASFSNGFADLLGHRAEDRAPARRARAKPIARLCLRRTPSSASKFDATLPRPDG